MPISEPVYTTREDVKNALDVKETARNNVQIDRAIQAASRDIDGSITRPGGLLKRHFFPVLATKYFDWPNFQYAYPWRLWFDQWDLAAIPSKVTTGGQEIPLASINFEPANSGPPYTYLEIQRNSSYAFGVGSTPQRDIAITGPWGYGLDTDPAGTLAAAMNDATSTTAQISDSSLLGVGDLLQVDTERMLIQNKRMITTGQTQQGTGCTTASNADVALGLQDGTAIGVGEVVALDSERMLILDIIGNTATVKRAWDGSILATHSGATIYAPRQLTVARGMLGTTAAAHSNGAGAAKHRVPSLVKQLATAYALVDLTSESAGWAKQVGEGQGAAQNLGRSIPQLEAAAIAAYGRKGRSRVI